MMKLITNIPVPVVGHSAGTKDLQPDHSLHVISWLKKKD